jgi:L-cysteine:1D-myo-inositol 2-amino-2-deoxy-alpha-D-glucopyranoside ligase
MAVRLAIISHHYRADWDWTADSLESASARLAAWRAAVAASSPAGSVSSRDGAGERMLTAMRERLADDLDTPGAIGVVDEWAARATAADRPDGSAPLVRSAVDALLGITL